jgi:hypothetical protein
MKKQLDSRLLKYWPLWFLVIVWLIFSIYFITTMNVRGSVSADAATSNTRVLDKSDATYEICHTGSGYTQAQCADVQSRYNTEFLCNPDGKSCWVEAKY